MNNYKKTIKKIKNSNKKQINYCYVLPTNLGSITGPTGPTGPEGSTSPTGPTGATGSIEGNPYNLFVEASANPGGDGSQANPFQTIDEALAVAKPNSTINVLSGIYQITQQMVLNEQGLTIKGTAGAIILLEAAIIPFLIKSDNTTIDGLTITSNVPYPVEFIQIAGNNDQIINCNLWSRAIGRFLNMGSK